MGLIAVDASLDSSSNEVIGSAESKLKGTKPSYSEGTSEIATIRHFYVDELYRSAFAEDDLLEYALKHVFEASSTVQVVKALESPLQAYVGKALSKVGFKAGRTLGTIGVFRWKIRVQELRREDWRSI